MASTPANGRTSMVNGMPSQIPTQLPYSSPASNASAASNRAPSTVLALQARRSFLDESALSPQEFLVYLSSFASIKPSPSGQPGLIDEQDGLRYLREECGMSMADELEILPLFERTPLGLASGHFFAMLRLVSWAQQGRQASKDLIFSQTKPARISYKKVTTPQSASAATFGNVQQVTSPGPRSASVAAPTSAPIPSKPIPIKPDSSTKPLLTPVREEPQSGLPSAEDLQQAPARPPSIPNKPSAPPAVPAKPHMPQLVAPKPKVANPNIPLNLEELQRKPSIIPPSSSANPFRDGAAAATTSNYTSGSGYAVALGAIPSTPANIPAPTGSLLGFDPAPNPFKQSKPRIVKPTPVRASSPASNPFRNGTPAMAAQSQFPKVVFDPADDAESSQASSSHSKPQHQPDRLGAGSPPLPPRPGDRNPPPLPPRHISPLIQAGLNARSEVRRAQESLPPKTFTVLQSSTSKHGGIAPTKPRLLTGQAAPREVVPPSTSLHSKKRSISGNKSLLGLGGVSTSSAVGVESRKAYFEGHPLQRQDSQHSQSDHGRQHGTDVGTSVRRSSSQMHRGESEVGAGSSMVSQSVPQRIVPTVAPKPVYAKKADSSNAEEPSVPKVKPTLPSWLKEQEELQREALASGSEPPPPPPIQPTEGGVRGRASRTVIDDLNDSAEAMSDEAAAANAASIDRNNPFFPPHRRDAGRSPNPASADVEGQDDSQVSNNQRPLGRSKTMSSATRPPPPRRRVHDGAAGSALSGDEQPQWGHSLEAGTYAGFKPNKEPKNSGGLRLVPPSKQAKMLNVSGAEQLEQEGIRPAQDLRKVSAASGATAAESGAAAGGPNSESSSANGPMSPTTPSATYPSQPVHPGNFMRRQGSLGTTIREKVSDILRLQDQPPKGQRQVDLLGQDIASFVNKNEWLARKRDSLVRSTSGATRERQRLIGTGDHDETGHDAEEHEEHGRRRSGYAQDDEDMEEDGRDHYGLGRRQPVREINQDDGPHPDTIDPSHFRRQTSHQRSLSSSAGPGQNQDPFSSPPPAPQHSKFGTSDAIPRAEVQGQGGLRRAGSLNPKRSSSSTYPANNLSQAAYGNNVTMSSGATNPSTAAAAAAAANRRWSSFHHAQNTFNQLHPTSIASAKEDIGAWRNLRGSAVDEEDADEDVILPRNTATAAIATNKVVQASGSAERDHTGYAQL